MAKTHVIDPTAPLKLYDAGIQKTSLSLALVCQTLKYAIATYGDDPIAFLEFITLASKAEPVKDADVPVDFPTLQACVDRQSPNDSKWLARACGMYQAMTGTRVGATDLALYVRGGVISRGTAATPTPAIASTPTPALETSSKPAKPGK